MKYLFLVVGFFFSISAFAAPLNLSYLGGMGASFYWEKNQEQVIASKTYNNFMVGIGYQDLKYYFEGAYSKHSSQVGNIKIDSTIESYLIAVDWWSLPKVIGGSPYLSAGLGQYQQRLETLLAGELQTDTSKWYSQYFAGLGIRWDFNYMWTSVDSRMLYGDNKDPQVGFGILLRLGVEIQ